MNLFKSIVVNSILATIVATGFITSQNCYAETKKSLSNEERVYIRKLIKDIENVFDFFQKEIMLFIDIKDKTPYRQFVGDLGDCIDHFTQETFEPLKQNIKEYKDNNIEFKDNNNKSKDNVAYYQGLTIVDELLVEFLDKLNNMRLVLYKYVSVKDDPDQAFQLATELEPHIKALIAPEIWNKLKKKLQDVESLMKQIDERDIMIKLAQLKKVLEASQKGSASLKISPTALLTCIRKKIRYN